jgi:hypothetical protein
MIKYPKSDFLVWVAELKAGKWDNTLKPIKNSLVKKASTDEACCKDNSTYSASK